MHLVLTGATGLVGSAVLDAMLHTQGITKISILSRRPVPQAEASQDPRINVIIHKDFMRYDASVLEQLRDASGCVWALGISQTQVTADEYVAITKDYTLAAARAFAEIPRGTPDDAVTTTTGKTNAPFRFVYVSGEGATQNPGRFSAIFARVKGETETKLSEITTELAGKIHADSARPAFVDSAAHPAILPYVPTPPFQQRMLVAVLGPPLKAFYRSAHSPTPMLGDFLTRLAMGRVDEKLAASGAVQLGQSWIIGNANLRKIMGL